MTIYYTAIYLNSTSICSSNNIGNAANVTQELIFNTTNTNIIYNIIIPSLSNDSNEGKQERSISRNEIKSKYTVLYDNHYNYHIIDDFDGIIVISLCSNNNNRLFYFAFLIDLWLRFKTTCGSRIKKSSLSSSNYNDFSSVIDKQMLIFNSPGSVTLANIIISNRKLDLIDTNIYDHQKKNHLQINFHQNTNINNDNTNSFLILEQQKFKKLIIISIVIVLIIIIISASLLLSCGINFVKCK